MTLDINAMISLGSAFITLASLFGVFYKIRYQVEQLEKKQDKHNNLIERQYALEETTKLLQEKINENKSDIQENKQEIKEIKKEIKNGR